MNFEPGILRIYLSVPAIAALLSVVVWEDFKETKIRNKWILGGVAYGAMVNIAVVIFGALAGYDFVYAQAAFTLLNAVISFAAGYAMWKYGVWAAGDAKLFSLVAFLLPLDFYKHAVMPWFNSFALLINIFIPYILIVSMQALVAMVLLIPRTLKNKGLNFSFRQLFQSVFTLKTFSVVWGIVFALILIQCLVFFVRSSQLVAVLNNSLVVFLVIFLGQRKLKAVFEKGYARIFSYFLAVNIFLYMWVMKRMALSGFLESMFQRTLLVMALMIVFNSIINWFIKRSETKTIDVGDVKEGDVLSTETLSEIGGASADIGRVGAEGLTEEQRQILLRSANKPARIMIYRRHPFSIYIAVGAIITMLLKTSLIHFFTVLLRQHQ